MKTLQDLAHYLKVSEPKFEVPENVVRVLLENCLHVKELVCHGTEADRNKRFMALLIGLRDRGAWDVSRLARILLLRELFDVDICQLPLVQQRDANDRDWVEFCRHAQGAVFPDRQALARVGTYLGFSSVAPPDANAKGLCKFKEVFNQLPVDDIPVAIQVIGYFIRGDQQLGSFITQSLLPDWVCIWRTSPPDTKPIDVHFNEPKLKPHFEKHVCHLTTDANHPWQECVAWMDVLKYDDRITLDFLRTFLLKPTATDIAIMFPGTGPMVSSSMPSPSSSIGKEHTAQVRGLAKTLAARECFIKNYLCKSQKLVDSLWREYMQRYERIARDTLNACQDGFLYFETETGKIFFVGSVGANIQVSGNDYCFFVMARFYSESKEWEFSTLYMPDSTNNLSRIQEFRKSGHLWDGTISNK